MHTGIPGGTSGKKNPPVNAGDIRDSGSIPGSRRSPGEGNGNSLQHSCLKSSMDRGAWWATVHGVARSQTRLKQLSTPHAPHGYTEALAPRPSECDHIWRKGLYRGHQVKMRSWEGIQTQFDGCFHTGGNLETYIQIGRTPRVDGRQGSGWWVGHDWSNLAHMNEG